MLVHGNEGSNTNVKCDTNSQDDGKGAYVVQCGAVWCRVAVCYSALQCAIVCCSVP